MKLNKYFKGGIALWVILFTANLTSAQDLNEILQKANLQAQEYTEEFKNLLADETKTFEIYDKNGKLKKSSVIESSFIILQSEKSGNTPAEYRSVTKVDGKSVGDVEKRTADLFEQIAKAKSPAEELERIQKENARFDKNLEISGFTLIQAPVLDDSLRPFFEFSLFNLTEVFEDGNEYYGVGYIQTKPSANIQINDKRTNQQGLNLSFDVDLPDGVKKSDVFLSGILYINTKTFQIGREIRTLAAKKDNNTMVLQKSEFFYNPSEYGILLPRTIQLFQYKIKRESGKYISQKNIQAIFGYSRWRKSNVDVQILDDN